MSNRSSFFSSTVGSKILIGVTGLLLFGFLVTHLAGNLSIFAGSAVFNAYTRSLEDLKVLLWIAEAGLLALFLVHIVKTVSGYRRNSRARGAVGYAEKRMAGHTSRKGVSSTSMIVTGLATLVFVVVHIRTFKFGPYFEEAGTGNRDLFRVVQEAFQNPLIVGFYVMSMGLVGLHLSHGLSSALQSLGLANQRYSPALVIAGRMLAILIAGGFAALPIYVFVAY
jgi:succinate dehydrogenase / fumarate reductase, cytochrome b subunit